MSVTAAGPRVRAGLSEPEEKGESTVSSVPKVTPMASGAACAHGGGGEHAPADSSRQAAGVFQIGLYKAGAGVPNERPQVARVARAS